MNFINCIYYTHSLIPERDKHKAHWDAIKAVQDAMPHFPIIANGDVLKHEDIARIKEETGCSSVMIARGALWNCSVFSPIQEPNTVVAQKYVENVRYFLSWPLN